MILKITLLFFILVLLWIIAFIFYYNHQRRKLAILPTLALALPKSWKELNEKQFLYTCNLILWDNTPTEIHTKCFLYFTDIEVKEQLPSGIWVCTHNKKRFTIKEYEVQHFAKKLSFLSEMITEVTPLPEMAGFKHIHPRFEGVPFKQWIAAENYYQAFIYTKDENFLNMLCAVIYSSGIEFNDKDTQARSRAFEKVTSVHRMTVFVMYAGLKDRLSEQFNYFFQKVNTKGTSDTERKPPKMREHFNNMIYTLNGGDVTKTQNVLEVECWSAFDTLNRKAHENQETEQRLKKLNSRR